MGTYAKHTKHHLKAIPKSLFRFNDHIGFLFDGIELSSNTWLESKTIARDVVSTLNQLGFTIEKLKQFIEQNQVAVGEANLFESSLHDLINVMREDVEYHARADALFLRLLKQMTKAKVIAIEYAFYQFLLIEIAELIITALHGQGEKG